MSSQLESFDPEVPQSDREEEAVETVWSDSDIDETAGRLAGGTCCAGGEPRGCR